MKKILFVALLMLCLGYQQAQNVDLHQFKEVYVDVQLNNPTQVRQLAKEFSIDKVNPNASGFAVRLWLGPHDYDNFLSKNIDYNIFVDNFKASGVIMASTYEQMSSWNRYPTYGVYTAMMDTFQTRFPQLCRVDTILEDTPDHHQILALYIGTNLSGSETRPRYYYASSIHGDEPLGMVMLLRLADQLLNHYYDNAQINNILNSIDLWICPVENPDGMYAGSNDNFNGSTRSNANGYDLNRSFPNAGAVTKSYQPEVEAMIQFAENYHFTMSSCFHGGSEVFNFPWDRWTSDNNSPADSDWWWLLGRQFADTCHKYAGGYYFTDESNGVTPGGDWYVITGSQQDYLNYYQNCRDVTIEISGNKTPSSTNLPTYWTRLHQAMINHLEQANYGFSGSVTDSITGEPLEAMVWVENHDRDNSHVFSHLPQGRYFRPIKAGTYQVTFSAEGYYDKTITVTTLDNDLQILDVQLVAIGTGVKDISLQQSGMNFKLYPNPCMDKMTLCISSFDKCALLKSLHYELYDVKGLLLKSNRLVSYNTDISVSDLPAGNYVLIIKNGNQSLHTHKFVVKR